MQSWYESYCKTTTTATTTTAAGAGNNGVATGTAATSISSSSTSSSNSSSDGGGEQKSWYVHLSEIDLRLEYKLTTPRFATHYKWVIMLIVIFLAIAIVWTVAILLRKRYIRKKEREIEMRPPVAIGPHQHQAMTGGYTYGDGVVDTGRKSGGKRGGHGKEMRAEVTPADGTREKGGWLRKVRK